MESVPIDSTMESDLVITSEEIDIEMAPDDSKKESPNSSSTFNDDYDVANSVAFECSEEMTSNSEEGELSNSTKDKLSNCAEDESSNSTEETSYKSTEQTPPNFSETRIHATNNNEKVEAEFKNQEVVEFFSKEKIVTNEDEVEEDTVGVDFTDLDEEKLAKSSEHDVINFGNDKVTNLYKKGVRDYNEEEVTNSDDEKEEPVTNSNDDTVTNSKEDKVTNSNEEKVTTSNEGDVDPNEEKVEDNSDSIATKTILEGLLETSPRTFTERTNSPTDTKSSGILKLEGLLETSATAPIQRTNTPTSSKTSRELKSILALSKEARMDTNIAYKRKSLNESIKPGSKKKRRHSMHLFSEGDESEEKRATRCKNPEFVEKQRRFLSSVGVLDRSDDVGGGDAKGHRKRATHSEDRGRKTPVEEPGAKRSRKTTPTTPAYRMEKDLFCWRCHREVVNVSCEICVRSYHHKCLKQAAPQSQRWICPECVMILKAENVKQRSPAMKNMTLEHLCGLLKFALKRMEQVAGCEHFKQPVCDSEFPDYKNYVIQPMDLSRLEQNIKDNVYGSTHAFESDASWLLHNSIVFNSNQSKLTSIAKQMLKICRQEMSEIENCANCYLNANTKKSTWFLEVCPKPHLPVWAKLKGFPYWPAKAMRCNQGLVDVRFFGAHDRAWVRLTDCYLYSLKDPNSNKQMRSDIIECVKELDLYVANLAKVFGEVRYASYRVPLDLNNEVKQLQLLFPKYKPRVRSLEAALAKRTQEGASSTPTTAKSQNETRTVTGISKLLEPKEKKWSEDSSDEGEECSSDSSDDNESLNSLKERKRGRLSGALPGNRGRKAKMRGGKVSTNPRHVTADSDTITKQLSRRNSHQNIQTDSDQLLPNMDKINKVDNLENFEINLGNSDSHDTKDVGSSKEEAASNGAPGSSVEKKRTRIVQLNISGNENEEFTISPQPKSKMVDQLVDQLTEKLCGEKIRTTVDSVKRNLATEECLFSAENDKSKDNTELKSDSEKSFDKTDHRKGMKDLSSDEVSKIVGAVLSCDEDAVDKEKSEEAPAELPPAVDSTDKENLEGKEAEETDATSATEVVTHDTQIDEADIRNIIHLSLQDEPVDKAPAESTEAIETLKPNESTNSNDTLLPIETASNQSEKVVPFITLNGTEEPMVIKIESNSDDEFKNDTEYMERKRCYLSALNISERLPEKPKLQEIRTRSRTEDKQKNKLENLTRVINEVAVNYKKCLDKTPHNTAVPPPTTSAQISIRPLLKMQSQKQRARKSFQAAPPSAQIKILQLSASILKPPPAAQPVVKPPKPEAHQPTPVVQPALSSVSHPPTSVVHPLESVSVSTSTTVPSSLTASSLMYIAPNQPIMNNLAILPTNYTANMTSPVLTMVPHPVAVSTTPVYLQPSVALSTIPIPTTTTTSQHNSSETRVINCTSSGLPNEIAQSSAPEPSTGEDYSFLNDFVPEWVLKAINSVVNRTPPTLKPRLRIEPGLPSSAGTISNAINSISDRLADYLRGMLTELLREMGTSANPEAEIAKLKQEMEELRYRHAEEMLELKRNIHSILRDMQKSFADARGRIVDETRTICEADAVKRVEEAKSKQWCANCSKEAQFYCCWNTSYCDYPCQQKHWPQHVSKCIQNSQASQSPATVTTVTTAGKSQPQVQPLILRQTSAPSKAIPAKALIAKPAKVFVSRSGGTKGQLNLVRVGSQTPSGNITLLESLPGKYELLGNGTFKVGNSIYTGSSIKIKSSGNLIPTASAAPSLTRTTSSTVTTPSTVRIETLSKPVAVSDDSD